MRRCLLSQKRQLPRIFKSNWRAYCNLSKESDAVAILTLDNGPVNTFDGEMFKALTAAVREAESDKDIKSLVITSAEGKKAFSGGLDLKCLHGATFETMSEFWKKFRELWITVYGTRLSTVAAMNGHALAAGAIVASACDHRIIVEGAKIGMNEAQFGLIPPVWASDAIMQIMGHRNGEKALTLGTIFTSEEAMAVGLVDQVVPLSDVFSNSMDFAKRSGKVLGRSATKQMIRQSFISHFHDTEKTDVDLTVSIICGEKMQQGLGTYLASLKK